ncbi:MAG: M1 family aminopeptidase, partial [Bacteroidota bacterium]
PSAPFMVRMTFGEKMDGLYNIPDVVQQNNLAITAYMKPAQMLHALRDQVLGEERFDRAFREYVRRWAFKHPTPWDFFHTMENVSGEDLGWFWRSWVLNAWKLDLAVKEVRYKKGDYANGAEIIIETLEKMPMPVTVKVVETNGSEHKLNLPVEIWQRGAQWTFGVPTTSEIKQVVLDPDKKLPDWDRNNNTWKKGN